jgi:hypothetical protein
MKMRHYLAEVAHVEQLAAGLTALEVSELRPVGIIEVAAAAHAFLLYTGYSNAAPSRSFLATMLRPSIVAKTFR